MLMDNGKLMRKQFAKSKIDLSEFLMTARQAGYFDLSEVKSAILEYNGKISFLPYAENAPLTPSAAAYAPADAPVFYPIILDGKLIGGLGVSGGSEEQDTGLAAFGSSVLCEEAKKCLQ